MKYNLWQNLVLVTIGFTLLIFISRHQGYRGYILKIVGTIIKNSALGIICILFLNSLASLTALVIPINWLTLITGSILGIPGIVSLTMLKLII